MLIPNLFDTVKKHCHCNLYLFLLKLAHFLPFYALMSKCIFCPHCVSFDFDYNKHHLFFCVVCSSHFSSAGLSQVLNNETWHKIEYEPWPSLRNGDIQETDVICGFAWQHDTFSIMWEWNKYIVLMLFSFFFITYFNW